MDCWFWLKGVGAQCGGLGLGLAPAARVPEKFPLWFRV